jgi:hypothetical protein
MRSMMMAEKKASSKSDTAKKPAAKSVIRI